jgi:HEAT repeat protein
VALLLRDPLPALRAEAARALSRLATQAEIPILLEALNDPEADVRYWAAVALGNLASPSAVLALIRLARREPVAEVRDAAREAIPKTAW